jgi:hypothetical protein
VQGYAQTAVVKAGVSCLTDRKKWAIGGCNGFIFVQLLQEVDWEMMIQALAVRRLSRSSKEGVINGVRTRLSPHAALHVRQHSSQTRRDDGNTQPIR